MRCPLLAGLIGTLLLAPPVEAAPLESWSASILGGPLVIYTPFESRFDDEFALRASASRRITGPWDAGIEAGYTRFGFYYDFFGGDMGPPYVDPDGEYLDSIDLSIAARWHPNLRTFHPYVTAGAGAHAVHGYFPDANPLELSRQIKPGLHVGVGLHGIIRPALGVEVRWLTIYDNTGPEDNRNKDLLSILFSLTKE